jgi:hypothetical protein
MGCRDYVYAPSNEDEMVWEKAQTLRTFVERHPDHPHVAIIQRLIDLGGDEPGLGLQVGPGVITLWRALHREINEGEGL